MKTKIYSPSVANGFFSILPASEEVGKIALTFNTRSLLDGWRTLDFVFDDLSNGKAKKPEIRMLGGGFAFRGELKDLLFPTPQHDLEFLTICVSGEPWFVTNCLSTTMAYRGDKSVVYRDLDKTIFMVIYVALTDPMLSRRTFFVIEDSNRAFLLTVPEFVHRVSRLGLGGIIFREIGVLE